MRLEKISVGKIVNAHGIRGEIRVSPRDINNLNLYQKIPAFYLDNFNNQAIIPESIRIHKNFLLMKLPGINTMDAALNLKGKILYCEPDSIPRPNGEFFDEELINIQVYNGETGEFLGKITEINPYPAGKVYTIKGEKLYLVPAVRDAFILSVDLNQNRMDIRVWDGLAVDE